MARDRVVSQNMRGVAADWGPFHSRKKREDMIAWTREQPYCAGLPRSLKPVARPDAWNEPSLMADLGTTRPVLPTTDGVIAYSIDGAIVPKLAMANPVIATSGMTAAQADRMID